MLTLDEARRSDAMIIDGRTPEAFAEGHVVGAINVGLNGRYAEFAGSVIPSDADVVLPLTVVEELDGLKSRSDDVGRAARTALRTLEELRTEHGGSLAEPVPIGNGATLVIEINNIRKHLLVEHGLDPEVPDNRIIGAAIGQSELGPTTMEWSPRPTPICTASVIPSIDDPGTVMRSGFRSMPYRRSR